MTVYSDSMGYHCDFKDIPGLEEAVYAMYNTDAMIAWSNDAEEKILSDKEMFGIPETE